MTPFQITTLAGWLGTVVAARMQRGARLGVVLGIYSLLALAMEPVFRAAAPLFVAFHATVYLNFIAVSQPSIRPYMRLLVYRVLLSWPAAFFSAGTLLALPWAIPLALGFHPWVPWLPYALGAVGLLQSLTGREEEIDVVIGGPGGTARVLPHPRGDARVTRPLRIVQITDPHLGPFMSVARLRRIVERAVAKAPDVVFLTGDFLTVESRTDLAGFTRALEPLRGMPGKVFACYGNHAHEAPDTVASALSANGITLLVDDERTLSTPAGPIQIVGLTSCGAIAPRTSRGFAKSTRESPG